MNGHILMHNFGYETIDCDTVFKRVNCRTATEMEINCDVEIEYNRRKHQFFINMQAITIILIITNCEYNHSYCLDYILHQRRVHV